MGICSDITGQRFGRLVVNKRVGTYVSPLNQKHALWECVCDCGNITNSTTGRLRSGNTKSCGCFERECKGKATITHGESKTRLYRIWLSMIRRCENVKERQYKDYGGRGITICQEWRTDFSYFKNWALNNGYKNNLSIDRIDVNGSYCSSNCRWITISKQQDNRRNTIRISKGDVERTAKEWSEITGIPYNTIRGRFYRGYSVDDILNTDKIPWGTYSE